MTIVDRANKPGHDHGQKAERKTAKRVGGSANAGSGSIEGFKGDITLPTFLVENKSTEHRSISVKLDWLEKITREARERGKSPALSIQFVDKQGTPLTCGRWVMIPEDEFKDVISEEG